MSSHQHRPNPAQQQHETTASKPSPSQGKSSAPAPRQHRVLQMQQRYGNQRVMRMMESGAITLHGPATVQPFFGAVGDAIGGAVGGAADTVGGAVGDAADAVSGVVETAMDTGRAALEAAIEAAGLPASTILSFIDQAGAAAESIYSDPVGFANNLMNAIKTGLLNFMHNMTDHLVGGTMDWLGSVLEGAGVELPERFDAQGIFQFVLNVLGVTVQAIRERIIQRFGRTVLRTMERTFRWLRGGVIALHDLWDFMRDSASALAGEIKGALAAVIHNILRPAIARITSLFNPVGSILAAVRAIYRVITFLGAKVSQIANFVSTVTSSLADIASGAIGAVAQALESALAAAIPAVIGFLADLIGLGGIAERIGDIIARLRGFLDRVIDTIIGAMARIIGLDDAGGDTGGDDGGADDGGDSAGGDRVGSYPSRGATVSETFSRRGLG